MGSVLVVTHQIAHPPDLPKKIHSTNLTEYFCKMHHNISQIHTYIHTNTFIRTWFDNKVRELDISGIVRYEFVPTGQTVHQVYYLKVRKRLRENV